MKSYDLTFGMSKTTRRTVVIVAAAALLLVLSLLPGLSGVYSLHVADVVLVNVLIAVGLNYILGFGGQISLSQAAFFGFGAYGYSILTKHGVPPLIAAAVGIGLGMGAGLLIGWPTLKLRGHYLALGTLGFGIIFSELITNFSITGGANGLSSIPPLSIGPVVFDTDSSMYYLLLVVAVIGVAASLLFVRSPLGMRARAMRDDEIAAKVAGVDVGRMKLMLFVVSAGYGSTAGVLYSSLLGYISPDVFQWDTTFNYLMMVVVGGLGSTLGAVIGAVLLTELPEHLRFLQAGYLAAFGLVVMVMMAVAPGGLVGIGKRMFIWLLRRLRIVRSDPNPVAELADDSPLVAVGEANEETVSP